MYVIFTFLQHIRGKLVINLMNETQEMKVYRVVKWRYTEDLSVIYRKKMCSKNFHLKK